MQSALVIVFMSLMMAMISDPKQWWLDYAQGQRRMIAQMMGYYNGQGVAMCGDALSEYHNHGTALPSQCRAGVMPLVSANGASGPMQYGVAFTTFTDGNTYIATTVQNMVIGHVSLKGITDDGILSEMGSISDGAALYVGRYSVAAGGIVINDLPFLNNALTTERIIRRTIILPSIPVSMRDGQPFLVTMLY